MAAITFATIAFACGATPLQDPAPAKHYVLVAAMGQHFMAVEEEQSTGTRLPPFRRRHIEAANALLDRLVLQSLDESIARAAPAHPRLLYAVPLPASTPSGLAIREGLGLRSAIAALQGLPGRAQWHRVIVVTPAFHAMGRDDLPARTHGLGVFFQPRCDSDQRSCALGTRPPTGPLATTPEGEVRPANFYVAPYSYLKFWTLDPVTLDVLDQYESFDHQKLASTSNAALPSPQDPADRTRIALNIQRVIDRSVQAAVAQGVLGGKVEVGDLEEVKPAK
ncbi:MAG: hypothetical protein JNK75_00655 [Betaproteobacteria bacterium]|nr:hypothetical protein [Betaproteobacteria bacterium]